MKLTLVSITIRGHMHSAFVTLEKGVPVTEELLCSIFPALRKLPRGCTYSVG